jgi:hypothetical protein
MNNVITKEYVKNHLSTFIKKGYFYIVNFTNSGIFQKLITNCHSYKDTHKKSAKDSCELFNLNFPDFKQRVQPDKYRNNY